MLPEGVTAISSSMTVEPGPAPHSRIPAIRADDPARSYLGPSQVNCTARNTGNRSPPQQVDPKAGRSFGKDVVQCRAAQTQARRVVGERGVDGEARGNKSNA